MHDYEPLPKKKKVEGFHMTPTPLQAAVDHMVVERVQPGHLACFASALNVGERERLVGLAPDYTNAVELTHRFKLLSQVVPVAVQAFVFGQLHLRVGKTRLSKDKKATIVAQLEAAIKADKASLVRNEAALARARAA